MNEALTSGVDLNHGGNLHSAAQRYGIPVAQWIDLSTGISPWSWPVPPLPQQVWRSLPQPDEDLEQAAAQRYGCAEHAVLAVPGSQYALQTLPVLLPPQRVALPVRGYGEHAAAWMGAGHVPCWYEDVSDLLARVAGESIDYAVVINPNNPTARFAEPGVLRSLHAALQARGGLLVVDEAFADCSPAVSLAPMCPCDGLVVLRSLGKFYGLAGVRLGFALLPARLRELLLQRLPPWSVSHPARWIGRAALADEPWTQMQRRRLVAEEQEWRQQLAGRLHGLSLASTPMFVSVSGPAEFCRSLQVALAQRGILVRGFTEIAGNGMLRFGLPGTGDRERCLATLDRVLQDIECVVPDSAVNGMAGDLR